MSNLQRFIMHQRNARWKHLTTMHANTLREDSLLDVYDQDSRMP